MAFNHENLKVYQQTLLFNAKVSRWVCVWDTRHSICDHLPRAAGSILENIAMASAANSSMKVRSIEYAAGSALECAACLDLAMVKHLIDVSAVDSEKEFLSQIFKMLIGLRRSWLPIVKEEHTEYGIETENTRDIVEAHDKEKMKRIFFHHERLDVYSVALHAVEAFTNSASVQHMPSRTFRRLDDLLTSMVLNIAEGNGRFCVTDQRRFIGTAHEAAIKTAARLDLCAIQDVIPTTEIESCKNLLSRVSIMTLSMIAASYS